jgi:hypothetical protein
MLVHEGGGVNSMYRTSGFAPELAEKRNRGVVCGGHRHHHFVSAPAIPQKLRLIARSLQDNAKSRLILNELRLTCRDISELDIVFAYSL